MSTIIELEPGDTPASVWRELDILSKIQLKNRVEKLTCGVFEGHEGEAHICETTPYGKRCLVRVKADFEHDQRAIWWGNEFISEIRKDRFRQPIQPGWHWFREDERSAWKPISVSDYNTRLFANFDGVCKACASVFGEWIRILTPDEMQKEEL